MSTHLETLLSKLNATCLRATERAASITMARGHHDLEIEHLLVALLEDPGSDLAVLCRRFDVSSGALQGDLDRELARLKTGNTRTPVIGTHLAALLEQAWLIASLEAHDARIRSAHVLIALRTRPDLSQIADRASLLFRRFDIDALKHTLDEATRGSAESGSAIPIGTATATATADRPAPVHPVDATAGPSGTPALDQFTVDLTQRAREGRIDPVIGRDAEIRQAIDILMRRRQNNPILTGEAGVGKTAVAEGLALRIAAGDVPEPLRPVALRTLDLGLLQAGASVKGEFENRLKNVILEVKRSLHPIVLFIDEAHTLIGAGGQAGQSDAANLLKPALARGELRTVAATTWREYKKYFEKDAALARRFQVIKVEEPSEPLAAAMLRGMAPLMETHFGVRIRDEAITEAVRLSARYLSGRQLPDKAIAVLDTACARVALGQHATPAPIEDLRREIERLDAETASLQREVASGAAHGTRLQALSTARGAAQAGLDALAVRHAAEQRLVADIQRLRAAAEATAGPAPGGRPAPAEPPAADLPDHPLQARRAELAALQADLPPLVPLEVDAAGVAAIVSGWTGVPLGRMVRNDLQTVLDLQALLRRRVVGQDHALAAIAQHVRTSRANLDDPGKPKGVFLFVGPSGVGKTETAAALADLLYGGERKLITINLSEYQEPHSVSGLRGSPPGYVGFGEGGVLTEAVRRNPYSVVLLDEAEKAHPDVLEVFYRVFDQGLLDDAEGREVDFRNCIVILTSNVGSAQTMQACLGKSAGDCPDPDALATALRPLLARTFRPALLGRLKVIPYYPIGDDALARIIRMKLDRIARRVRDHHHAELRCDASLVDAVLARCTEVDTGARNVDHILSGTLLPALAGQVLRRMADGRAIERIRVSADKDLNFRFAVQPR